MIIDTDDYSPNTLALQLLTDYRDLVKESIANRCSHHSDIADAVLNARDDSDITEAINSAASCETQSLSDAARVLVASSNRDAYRDMIGRVLSGDACDIMDTMAYYAARQDITEAINALTDDEVCEAAGIAVCAHCNEVCCDVPSSYHDNMNEGDNKAARTMLPDGWALDRFGDPICPDCAEECSDDDLYDGGEE